MDDECNGPPSRGKESTLRIDIESLIAGPLQSVLLQPLSKRTVPWVSKKFQLTVVHINFVEGEGRWTNLAN